MRRKTSGFSIIEVLLSFTILTVAVLALLGLMPVAAKQQTSSDMQNRALYLAQNTLDSLLLDPARLSQALPATTPFTVTRTIAPALTSASVTPSLVTVDISWVEQGRVRRVTLRSQVAP